MLYYKLWILNKVSFEIIMPLEKVPREVIYVLDVCFLLQNKLYSDLHLYSMCIQCVQIKIKCSLSCWCVHMPILSVILSWTTAKSNEVKFKKILKQLVFPTDIHFYRYSLLSLCLHCLLILYPHLCISVCSCIYSFLYQAPRACFRTSMVMCCINCTFIII